MGYALALADLAPASLVPMGDRYLVEILTVDESVNVGGTSFVIARPPKRDLKGREIPEEESVGWKAGVILARGNGMLLDVPNTITQLANITAPEDLVAIQEGKKKAPSGVVAITEHAVAYAVPAHVPMLYGTGQVVLIERFAGREITLGAKTYCIIAQGHILCETPLRLRRGANGWEETLEAVAS